MSDLISRFRNGLHVVTEAEQLEAADTIESLQSEITDLKRQAEEARKDAEMYRARRVAGWIRNHTFIGLPELTVSTDKPLFDFPNAAIKGEK